jgi:hypothetical protein
MIAICKDCQQIKKAHLVFVLRDWAEIIRGVAPVEEVMLCDDCAIKRAPAVEAQ